MNCKLNDLAIFVNHPFTKRLNVTDRIVRLVKADITSAGFPAWQIEPVIETAEGLLIGAADCVLRPIRDQKGDDETLSWSKVPTNDYTSV